MRHPRLIPAFLLALAACQPTNAPPPAVPPPVATAASPQPLAIALDPAADARIASDIRYLAGPDLAGRGTGEPGAQLAAAFVAQRFSELGLTPFGDPKPGATPPRSFRTAFLARVGADVKLASLEAPSSRTAPPRPRISVVAAEGSASAKAAGSVVFVGFGITAPAAGWDDYAGADVAGKIAVVLDGAGDGALRDFRSVRYKLRTAREHKAAGVVVIARGEHPQAPADASSMGVPAVVISVADAKTLLPTLKLDKDAAWAPKKPVRPAPLAGTLEVEVQIQPREVEAWNVAALLPARAESAHANEYVVVGAHYDHLGWGGTSASLAPGVHAIHPGADDNASGTALVLEVARRLRELPRGPARNVLFLAFGGEELGTLGSRDWVEHPPVPLTSVVAMINADMVGRLRDDRLMVEGVGTAAGWTPLIEAANLDVGLHLVVGAEGFGASDHMSFTTARIPVAFLFTGAHDDYHRPSDTADKINAAGEAKIAALAARLALGVAESDQRLAFVDVPADPHAGMGRGFKVSLGTIPDYAWQGKGLRLSGVRPDAPASRAGIAAGDVIVKVGAHEVTNIHDYMFALGELEAGREVVIEVLRDGRTVQLKVIPAPGR